MDRDPTAAAQLSRCLSLSARPTIGTSTMVIHHVRRSVATLTQRYDRLAATRGLTDEEKKSGELVATFYKSLPEPRSKLIIAAGLFAAFIVTRVITVPVSNAIAKALRWLFNDQGDPAAVRTQIEATLRAGSAVPTAGSFMDLFDQFAKAGPGELLTLASTLAVAGYLVLRPLSSAFRIKRIIFNLAANGKVNLNHTTVAWNIPRSVGLYQSEQTVFTALGARRPREFAFDLWISVIPAGVLLWALWPGSLMGRPTNAAGWVLGIIAATTIAGARIAWLIQTGRARPCTVNTYAPPAGFCLPGTHAVVEARSALETAALGFISFLFLWAYPLTANFVVPSPIWVRLVRERREWERALHSSPSFWHRHPRAHLWPALGSALLLSIVPPIALAVHLTHLARIQPPGVGSARRTRAWLVPLSAAVTVLVVLNLVGVVPAAGHGICLFVALVMFAGVFAAVQHEHNALAVNLGQPLPNDDPQPPGALPREAYTSWGRRTFAALIDAAPPLLLGAVAFGVFWIPEPGCEKAYVNCQLAIAGSWEGFALIASTMLAALMLAAAYTIWNGYRQVRTGSSVGKSALKFRVVSEKTCLPLGFWSSTLRLLLHTVDVLPIGIGFLLPLCDSKRRTIADEIMSTVCLPIPPQRRFADGPDLMGPADYR
ncbi:RDD family protein [Mycobacterium heidelbergense]|uniref:RDD family protein n=1 Tax=Mycobacterium heidelbergense TaxID=53376 RepID=UPI003CED39D7